MIVYEICALFQIESNQIAKWMKRTYWKQKNRQIEHINAHNLKIVRAC